MAVPDRETGTATSPRSIHSPRLPWLLALPYPVRVLLRRWTGTIGMVLGVGLALGIGMTLLAVSQASVELFTGDYRASGVDLYVVTRGGKLISFLPGDSPGTIKHAREKLSQIRRLPGVTSVIGFITWPLERERADGRQRNETEELIVTVGVDGDATTIPGVVLLTEGRWLRRADEIVLGQKLSREKGLGVGRRLRLGGRDFDIVGIGRMRGVAYTAESFAYMDIRALSERADLGDIVNVIMIDSQMPGATRARIPELGSLDVAGQRDLIHEAEEANRTAIVLRWIILLLILAIAGLFVASMLGGSVAARRLEFATLRAIGMPGRSIMAVVGGEALFICLAAGLVGFGFSLGVGALINSTLAPMYGIESLYVVDAWLFSLIMAMGLALGLIAGLVPAREAARIDPVEALREA